jgi:hypothetical protein
MKHPPQMRQHGYVAEWLQAIFTLLLLVSLSTYSLQVNDTKEREYSENIRTSSYWDKIYWYGFHGNDQDTYTSYSTKNASIVRVSSPDSLPEVQVSFYPKWTPDSLIHALQRENSPNIMTTISNGTVIIEWDLSSSRAKNILATLNPR